MGKNSEEEIREALAGVLDLYNIKIEEKEQDIADRDIEGDYSEIISKTQARLDDLNEQAEEIFTRTGMTREQLEVYATNPNNFTKEQWDALQKVKEACDRYKREARGKIKDPQFEKKVEKQQRKKQPHRFAKKKNWIPL